jgi:hypothetical protein
MGLLYFNNLTKKGVCKMRTTDTFENVIGKVHRMSLDYYDEVIPIRDMEFEGFDNMTVGYKEFEVLPSAQRLIANRLRIPQSYLSRCPEYLQSDNLNYWLERERKNRETLFCRFSGNKLRGVFTQRYTALDNMEVLTKMLEYGFDPSSEVHFSLDESLMVLKVPEYARMFGLTEKDKIVPGICIANSEVGILALSIEAFFYRLVCSNGLIATTSVGSRFKHVSRKAMDEFPQVLNDVVYQSQKSQGRFRISMQTPVDNPLNTIETFAKQFQLSQDETEIVRQAYFLEQGSTMFFVINAFTRAAQASELSALNAYKLERVGGQILSLVK